MSGFPVKKQYDALLDRVLPACRGHYGDRLVSLLVFGSVGRGVPGPDSDLDLLLVAEPLPAGRLSRVAEFRAVEREFALYGDIDFIPTEQYSLKDARRAIDDARFVVSVAETVIPGPEA